MPYITSHAVKIDTIVLTKRYWKDYVLSCRRSESTLLLKGLGDALTLRQERDTDKVECCGPTREDLLLARRCGYAEILGMVPTDTDFDEHEVVDVNLLVR